MVGGISAEDRTSAAMVAGIATVEAGDTATAEAGTGGKGRSRQPGFVAAGFALES